MLKLVALGLLLANLLLLASQWGFFEYLGIAENRPNGAKQREPERLARQVNPQAVSVLSAEAASAALGAAAASAAQSARDAVALCLEAGPFSASEASVAERTLRDLGLPAGSWLALKIEDRGSYLLYMGRYANRDTLQAKHEQLKRMKVEAEDLRNLPELQPGLSLGRFDNKPDADALRATLLLRGVRTARVVVLRKEQSLTMLRLPAADATVRARLAGLRLPSGPGFVACTAPVEAARAAAPVAAVVEPVASPAPASKRAPLAAAAPNGASARR
jgi:hypothetical protein